jgi:hypothetical protein
MIATAGVTGVLIFDVALMWPELSTLPRADSLLPILNRGFSLAPITVILFGFIVLLLVTAEIVLSIIRVRNRIERQAPRTQEEWFAAFSRTGIADLHRRLLRVAPSDAAPPSHKLLLEGLFEPTQARQELARFYRNLLTRSHFFTALAVLLGALGAGLAQQYRIIEISDPPIATAPILAGFCTLMILVTIGRLAVDAAAEPLLNRIDLLPVERLEIALLHDATLAPKKENPDRLSDVPSEAISAIMTSLTRAVDGGRQSFDAAVAQLMASAEALISAARIFSDQLQHVHNQSPADSGAQTELRAAIEQLTTVIETLPYQVGSFPPLALQESVSDTALLPASLTQERNMGSDLRRLLRQLE